MLLCRSSFNSACFPNHMRRFKFSSAIAQYLVQIAENLDSSDQLIQLSKVLTPCLLDAEWETVSVTTMVQPILLSALKALVTSSTFDTVKTPMLHKWYCSALQ